MRDVVRVGTAARAMKLGRQDLAGKTGTTNDFIDAWFCGFNASLVAVAWIGFDTPQTLGRNETGGAAALPMWMGYMGAGAEGRAGATAHAARRAWSPRASIPKPACAWPSERRDVRISSTRNSCRPSRKRWRAAALGDRPPEEVQKPAVLKSAARMAQGIRSQRHAQPHRASGRAPDGGGRHRGLCAREAQGRAPGRSARHARAADQRRDRRRAQALPRDLSRGRASRPAADAAREGGAGDARARRNSIPT